MARVKLAPRNPDFDLLIWTVWPAGQVTPEPHEAETALWEWFEHARSAEQMIGRVLQALIAAHHADETAVTRTRRAYYSLPGRYGSGPMTQVPELVEKLAKRVLPARMAEQLAEAQAQRAEWAADTQQD